MEYSEFLNTKQKEHARVGFKVKLKDLNPYLFDWQKEIVRWSLFTGRSAIFEACGLGKTLQQLEWANQINKKENRDVLILAPLAVSHQTRREGDKFGIDVNVCRSQNDVRSGINITNYEMVGKFDPDHFAGIVLDESSILKAFMGKTKQKIINLFKETRYKLACTATPSPNDHMELLNHSDFLNVMPSNEALSRWFINDTMNFGTYRLKNHGVKDFWKWVSSWAVAVNKPSDIGYDDDGFILPRLKTTNHIVKYKTPYDIEWGELLKEMNKINATGLYRELRETADARTDKAAELVNQNGDGWVIWCHTNIEAQLLEKKIKDSVNVHGSLSLEKKEDLIENFSNGNIRNMITKPSMCGFGLNWQHVNHVAFVGLSFSFEQRYQAIRRIWRFGQKKEVFENLILSPAEYQQVLNVVSKKEKQHKELERKMIKYATSYKTLEQKKMKLKKNYKEKRAQGKNWELILGDAVEEIKNIKAESVHFSIFSPPFSNLYIYSDYIQDMGNSQDDKEFFKHFEFLITELKRITVQGRLCAVHCKDLVDYKSRDGRAGLRDIPGDFIRLFETHGWKYHSRVTIWKDPVIEMQRTKAQGLLHKQVKKDSSMVRQGLPDYLIIFRKWPDSGETSGPEPVSKKGGFKNYIGDNIPISTTYQTKKDESGITNLEKIPENDDIFSIHVWQRYASPVWFDIQQTNVLNCRLARDGGDEKHICPLQLDVIERSIHLWTNPNEVVFSPFVGIGSELYGAVKLGRYGLGIELKESYFKQAVSFLTKLEDSNKQLGLFNE
jgi:DNA modification methylase